MLIYPDTSIWNQLCDQRVDARALWSTLAERDARLLFGVNVLYELAKTFRMPVAHAQERGRELFSYFMPYVQMEIPVLKGTRELLREEAMHAAGQSQAVDAFWNQDDHRVLAEEVSKLSQGQIDNRAEEFILFRKAAAQQTRIEMHNHIEAQPSLKRILRGVESNGVMAWLAREGKRSNARRLLKERLKREFGDSPPKELAWFAKRLLAAPRYRVSHALVRSDIYLNWRYAHRGSLRGDLPDDAYHVVNASYSDVFLTTEQDQADQLSHAVVGIRPVVYTGDESLLTWLPKAVAQ